MAILRLRELIHIFIVFIICTVCVVDCKKKGAVIRITDENWQQVLEGEWLMEFYAPWCPACKALSPIWEAVSDWSTDLDIKVAAVDVTEEAGLSGRFMVTSLPSVYHVIDGEFRRYMGPRTENDIVTFIEDRKFQDVDMIPSWRGPDSISMSFVSLIFKVSMRVKIFHIVMTEEYGFPWWSTYGFIAVATVLMGLTLGMILVFLTDCCCPQKPLRPFPPVVRPAGAPHQQETTSDAADDDEDKEEGSNEGKPEEEEEEVERAEGTDETTVRQRKTGSGETEEQ